MSTNAPTKLPVKQSYASMAPTKLPVKQSYASKTHGDVISKGIQLNKENANCIQLSDNDLIKVEYRTFVGTSFSMESNNDGKHDDVENKDVDSDATIPPGFETFFKVDKHGSRSSRTGKCSTSFGNYKRKDMKGFSFIDEMNRMIEVGGALGYNIKGSIRSLRRMINGIGRSGGLVSMWDPGVFTKTRIWYGDNYIIVEDGVLQAHSDMHVTALDRLWSDRNLILLHCLKIQLKLWLQELDGLEKLECMDLVQKALLGGNID
ncbi:hypothetical protein Tco_0286662 [Tanacetum coccineum]